MLSELSTIGLPVLTTVLGEAVAYGEIGFAGAMPRDGAAAAELAALMAELRSLGWLPEAEKPAIRKLVKA